MTLFGIGIDVVEVGRIGASISDFGARFEDKVFTEREQGYCRSMKRPELHYAARFAAKEAVSKALGTGIGKDVGWLDMEIVRAENGEPSVVLSGAAAAFAERHGVGLIKVSLTHAQHYAAANAVVMCE